MYYDFRPLQILSCNQMLMTIYFLTILILEILFISLADMKKNKKYFKIFNGLFFSFFISIFLYFLYFTSDVYSYDTGEWVGLIELVESMFLCIANVVIGLIGLIFQKRSKKKELFIDTSKKGITIKYILIVSIISFIIVFSQFIIRYNEKINIENEVKEETMIYLKGKYGNDDFEIIDIDRNFAATGFIGTDLLLYYEIYAVYLPDNIEFYIELDVDNSRNILRDSSYDTLISKYFKRYFNDDDFKNEGNIAKEKLSEYLKIKQLNVNILLHNYSYDLTARDALQNNYGKIPEKEELYNLILDYHLKHEFEIIINEDEIKSEDVKSELREYLIKLSNYLIDYYDDLDDYEIICSYNGGRNKYFRGTININKEYINIDVGSIEEKIRR